MKKNRVNVAVVGFFCLVVGMLISNPAISSEYFDLGQLTDVNITGVTDEQVIKFNATDSIWYPANASCAGGFTYSDWFNQQLNTTDDVQFDHITFGRFLFGNFGGTVDASGDPWYLSGTSLQLAESLTVNHNITSNGYFIGDGSLLTGIDSSLWSENTTDGTTWLTNTSMDVGIGNDSPIHALHVSKGSNQSLILIQDSDGQLNDEAGLLFAVSDNLSSEPAKAGIFFDCVSTYGRGNLMFAINHRANSNEVTKDDSKVMIDRQGLMSIGNPGSVYLSGEGELYVDQYVEVRKGIYVGSEIVHHNDEDTNIEFNTNKISFTTGNAKNLDMTDTDVVFNENGERIDFRIEGDSDAELFFVSARDDNIGIGTTRPEYKLEVLGPIMMENSAQPAAQALHAGIFVDRGELYAIDESAHVTMLSPHDNLGDWIFHSLNTTTGNEVIINMMDTINLIERISGNKLIYDNMESYENRETNLNDILHLTPLANAPDSPAEGDIYYNSINHKAYCYDGTTWQGMW